ncbi:MAG: type IV secretory system conjugative DNA transfer family protein [Bosea sp.]|nr:type IV secretory system conjugative DNA transfer family protein [Bosea sp. (in: a-proteobacteria)]
MRWALLQSLNAEYSAQALLRSADHFYRRMMFPATQAETIIRGGIALGLVLAAGVGLAIAAHVLRPLKPYGEARFGSVLDAEKRKLTTRRGLILGRLSGATITSDEPGHVLVVGPTRSGKGQSFIGPNGIMWQGSAVFFDPKKENFAIFGAYRAASGDKVYLFNPGELRSHRYNPLEFIRRDATMPTDALVVAGFIVPDTPGEIWGKSARLLLAAMIGYVLTSPLCENTRHLRSVARMLVSGKDISAYLKSIVQTESQHLPSWVLDAFNQYIALEPETRNSAVFNLNIALNPWNNQLVAAATETSDFDIRELRRKRMSIFIGCSVAQLDAFRPLLNILIQQIHDVLMVAPPQRDEPHQVLLMIDEFRQLGRMDDLISKLTINAGYGFRVVIVLQNLSQLDEVYGKAVRETTVSACATQLYIRIDNLDTSEYLSKMLGETTIELKRASLRRGGMLGQKTINTDYDAVPLRTPQQLRQMDPRKIILLVSSAPPFELERVIYHDDRPYRQALEEVRFQSVSVPELEPYADAGGGLATAAVPASVGNNVSATPGAAMGSSQATKASAEPSLDVIERQADTPTVPVTRQSKPVRVGRVDYRQLAHDSRIPSTPTTSAGSLPIEVALTAQIEAGAAAFRQVMEGLPHGGEHDELIDQLQQMTMLHAEFGDDDRIFE